MSKVKIVQQNQHGKFQLTLVQMKEGESLFDSRFINIYLLTIWLRDPESTLRKSTLTLQQHSFIDNL